jgi:hypothetical protein
VTWPTVGLSPLSSAEPIREEVVARTGEQRATTSGSRRAHPSPLWPRISSHARTDGRSYPPPTQSDFREDRTSGFPCTTARGRQQLKNKSCKTWALRGKLKKLVDRLMNSHARGRKATLLGHNNQAHCTELRMDRRRIDHACRNRFIFSDGEHDPGLIHLTARSAVRFGLLQQLHCPAGTCYATLML